MYVYGYVLDMRIYRKIYMHIYIYIYMCVIGSLRSKLTALDVGEPDQVEGEAAGQHF